jgi:hypothetical protein
MNANTSIMDRSWDIIRNNGSRHLDFDSNIGDHE